MSALPAQTSRKALIAGFKKLGFDGPFGGSGKHPAFMQRGTHVVKIPNSHSKPRMIGRELLKRILTNAGISSEEWLGE